MGWRDGPMDGQTWRLKYLCRRRNFFNYRIWWSMNLITYKIFILLHGLHIWQLVDGLVCTWTGLLFCTLPVVSLASFLCHQVTKVWVKKRAHVQKLANSKKSTVLSNPNETWRKWLSHKEVIFTKFHEDWTKIIDFLLVAKFWTCLVFFTQTLVNL